MDEWKKRIWHILPITLFNLRNKEILLYATTWMKLEDTVRSEICQSQTQMIPCFHLFEVSKVVKLLETNIRMAVSRD